MRARIHSIFWIPVSSFLLMSNELQIAFNISVTADHLILKQFRRAGNSKHDYKAHHEIVTKTDKESNDLMIKLLTKAFPNDDIISEEAAMVDNPGKRVWYVDPLDGTTNFAYGLTNFSTCLGLYDSDFRVGVISIPTHHEFYLAEKGKGAWLLEKNRGNKKTRLHVSKRNDLQSAMTLTCSGYSPEGWRTYFKFLRTMQKYHSKIRQFGSAGIELSALAAGRADVIVLTDVRPWDVAAGICLVREAGGMVTDFQGRPWKPGMKTLLGTNGLMHPLMLKRFKNGRV
ncbi:MAG: inositol monophosphatase [Candidatus Magasanikbacteria bacterium]|nr:inositol monophosphatase [Candidatus Magasanikbacteria bacterium]